MRSRLGVVLCLRSRGGATEGQGSAHAELGAQNGGMLSPVRISDRGKER